MHGDNYSTHTHKFQHDSACSFTIYLFHDIKSPPLERKDVAYALLDEHSLNKRGEVVDLGFVLEQLYLAAPRSDDKRLIVKDGIIITLLNSNVKIEHFGEKSGKDLKSVLGL